MATSWDHVPPIAAIGNYPIDSPKRLIPCCLECNSLLNAFPSDNLEVRVEYIKQALRSRYRSLLKTPIWTSEEMSELKPALHRKVANDLLKAREIRERVNWIPYTMDPT